MDGQTGLARFRMTGKVLQRSREKTSSFPMATCHTPALFESGPEFLSFHPQVTVHPVVQQDPRINRDH